MTDVGTLLRARLTRQGEGLPYPGFRPFRRSEWPIFFGRERQVQALLGLLGRSHFICIHGASGGGKSSLIEAGVIATLEREHARLGTGWRTSTFRPGSSPLWNLARGILRAVQPDRDPTIDAVVDAYGRLTRPGGSIVRTARDCGLGGANLLLVADQFEELFRFRALGDEREVQRFVNLLLGVFDEQPKGIHVAVAMRTDFLDDCADIVGLAEAVNAAPYLTPALTEDDLRAAIRGPADLHGGKVDDDLVERLLRDSAGEQDRLPILQHTLMRCWSLADRQGTPGHLTVKLYESEDIHHVCDALDRHAEEVMKDLKDVEREVGLLFKALSERDAQGRPIRRPLPWGQLCAETGFPLPEAGEEMQDESRSNMTSAPPATLERIVNRFRAEDIGFLGRPRPEEKELKPDTIVDVAHEALIRRWRRMSRPAPDPETTGHQARVGWLWDVEHDSNRYRGLLGRGAGEEIGNDILDEMLEWWKLQPQHAAWAKRMAGSRDTTIEEARAGLERIEKLFDRSVRARARRKKTRRRSIFALLVVAAVIAGLTFVTLDEKLKYTQALQASDLALRERDQKYAIDVQTLLQQLGELKSQNKRLEDAIAEAKAPQAAVPDAAVQVTESARPIARAPAPASTASAEQACRGAIWIGAENALNLRLPGSDTGRLTLSDIRPDRTLVSTKNVLLRQGLPKEGYVQQESVGIVPEGAQIRARGTPVRYDRPAGTPPQYWLDIAVTRQVCSLVHFQFAGARDTARDLATALEKEGYLVPGQENLTSAQGMAEVRYYWPDDRPAAEQLAKDATAAARALNPPVNRQVTAVSFLSWPGKKPSRGTLELWFDLSGR